MIQTKSCLLAASGEMSGASDAACLTVAEGAEVVLPAGATVTVDGKAVSALGAGVWENVVIDF